jgi:hypothetical protein
MEQLDSHCTDLHEIWYLKSSWKSVGHIQFSLKSNSNNRYLTWRPMYIFKIISRSIHVRMRNLAIKVVDKIKHILCPITFFRKSCRLWDNVEKYCRGGRPQDDSMEHAHCTLHTVLLFPATCLIYLNCSLILQAAEFIHTWWQKCKCCFFLLAYLTLFIRFHSCNNIEFSLIFVKMCVMQGKKQKECREGRKDGKKEGNE